MSRQNPFYIQGTAIGPNARADPGGVAIGNAYAPPGTVVINGAHITGSIIIVGCKCGKGVVRQGAEWKHPDGTYCE